MMDRYSGAKNFDDFFDYLSKQKTKKYTEITSDIINEFKNSFKEIKLPKQYIEFMKYAGNGMFWEGSMYEFSEVKTLKKYATELLEENDFPHRLKESDFVFWMHGGYMFYFFSLEDGDNPPVYYYSECDEMSDFVRCSDTFLDFIINPYITGVPNP